MNYVLIGDIHSQARHLEKALKYIKENISNPKVIFLGDIFDSKTKNSDSYSVYSLVKESEKDLNSIILQSNHQDKLIRFIRGNKIYIDIGLSQTISELLIHISFEELYEWLIKQPFGIVFKDLNGIEYRCAHAYFNSEIKIQEYKNYYLLKAVQKHHKHQLIYGLQDSKKNRISWWLNEDKKQNFIRVAGHYRTFHLKGKSIVLDSCCGDQNGILSIYDVNSKTAHQFDENGRVATYCFEDAFQTGT